MVSQRSCEVIKQGIQKKLCELQTLLSECGNVDALTYITVNTHIGNAVDVLKAMNSQHDVKKLLTKRQFPPNKKGETQP